MQFFNIRKPIFFAFTLFFSLVTTGLLFVSGAIRFWDKILFDQCINYRVLSSDKTRNPLVATIDLNDTSIKVFGEELDTRQAFADIQEVLADSNAGAVFDFLFFSEKQHDSAFIQAIEWAGDTVVAMLAVDKGIDNPNLPYRELTEAERHLLARHIWHINVVEKGKVPEAGTFLLPFPELIEVAAAIAHINMDPDPDGVYRRSPLLYAWDGGYIPSLALAAAVVRLGIPIETIELKAGEYLALPRSEHEVIRIPIDIQGRMLIPYTETWAADTGRIPFHTVVAAKSDDAVFDRMFSGLNGRIALIAEISTSQKDFGPTSFERLYPLSGVHVEILSGILGGLEERAFIGWASTPYKVITILLLLSVAILCAHIRRDLLFHLGFLLTLFIFSAVTFYRWRTNALSPWYAAPVVLFFFLWAGAFLTRLFIRYREQLLLRNALSRYFPHALGERIMREGKTELIPAYKELTILFSDIAGFTKWSSDRKPDEVHAFLSDYLESMAAIIFSHGGTVDKFMGDGILAFFGDPFDLPNHCEQCLKSAIAMQEKARELAQKWKPIVAIDLQVRIGINIGKVIVGNLGNKTRIEYTVIGAAVNLAQRMESNAPLGGILVTAEVREKAKDMFTFPQRLDVTVKGYVNAIEAYVLSANS
ncbi:MAG: adenylate/guanylate cyclase domain-containing protein [Treponema sp.]|nr:adenylate/guanylate cyclase domain-containing protein [Treponema sp.]